MAGPYGANIFNPRGWASNNGAWTLSLVAEPTLMPFPLPFFLDIFCHLSRSHVTLTPTQHTLCPSPTPSWTVRVDETANIITLELTRVVLAIGVFAIGVELPKAYMRRHWKSLFFLLGPVMVWVSLFSLFLVLFVCGVQLHFLRRSAVLKRA